VDKNFIEAAVHVGNRFLLSGKREIVKDALKKPLFHFHFQTSLENNSDQIVPAKICLIRK